MPYSCPHCSEAIPDAVPKETMKQRLAAKDSQIADYKAEAREQRQRADGLEAASAEWRAAAEELAAVKARAAEDAAFAEAGLRPDLSDRHRRILRAEYEAATADQGDDAPPMGEWLKSELSADQPDPILAALRAPAEDTPTPPAGTAQPRSAPRLPVDRSTSAPPPPPTGATRDPGARFQEWLATAPRTEGGQIDYSQAPPEFRVG